LKAAAVGDRRETGAGVRLVTTAGIGALPTPGRFKALQSTADSVWFFIVLLYVKPMAGFTVVPGKQFRLFAKPGLKPRISFLCFKPYTNNTPRKTHLPTADLISIYYLIMCSVRSILLH
jgi:hypothetical protein